MTRFLAKFSIRREALLFIGVRSDPFIPQGRASGLTRRAETVAEIAHRARAVREGVRPYDRGHGRKGRAGRGCRGAGGGRFDQADEERSIRLVACDPGRCSISISRISPIAQPVRQCKVALTALR
jgi:hypothetical protein